MSRSKMVDEKGGPLHEVRASFGTPEAMQAAVSELEMSGFNRADLSLPEALPLQVHASPKSDAKPMDTGGAAAVVATAAAAAGVVIATGGAAAPALAAAVVGGGLAGLVVAVALGNVANDDKQPV